ncbi:Vi polysaccharide biosynthesis UDP-N-acetylglucosamine C-6 dehydrogenase TviB [Guyparkeria sp. SCN-R1]|uniref:Vi polysaccharide biosynthesis UDP-N-acetylglucosamine C-6 dehydrogenase TviB n=1 Tax=Guyparkeria sp. SCN-R1 TaxID=2341113 RepID=UPI000F654136|nr:Vi polysaccharide biosynthesis UDP-N-acetylglucosamine C-6 dehydrogenase TviB [Guyparkeria sp. SCN-R1]RRQ20152.1 Vi polysaccharide biosynthesis UDP-N-acetylglucosamine C-6 dehydrogenase TviB [Guyparkeria sp. SCN-R1]
MTNTVTFQAPKDIRIAMIGLGYVGLPLAVAFGRVQPVVGFDINTKRISELKEGIDHTREVEPDELAEATELSFTDRLEDIADCNVFIVTVPTPIDRYKRPDLGPLISASKTVGQVLKKNDVVIYESTVYPGATEDDCVPVLERTSGLTFNRDFFAGYSPERINPGDKEHRVADIMKVTSGSTPEASEFIDGLYRRVIKAGTHLAPAIRVAEAAKVIENTQRDVNIALVNELAMLFNKMGVDTQAVLEAAATKWNFLPFKPGLVGGHCIGVDPYYLTQKAQEIGYNPEMILAGRRTNDGMGEYVAAQVVQLMTRKRVQVVDSKVLILGLTFKENCPDLRNTRVMDVVHHLEQYNVDVHIHDPWADADEAMDEYGITLDPAPQTGGFDAVIIAVAHDDFRNMGACGIRALAREGGIVYDIKYLLAVNESDGRL